ncbi:MAG: urea carboxylase-associated family protein [Xanthobacteraceae bacterium]
MPSRMLWERQLARNVGFAFDVKAGQSVRILSQTIIDFVCFNRENVRERFDQARTKANQRKIFISAGDQLISKLNNAMMTIVEDTFKEGHHDLQEGMCSRKRHELAAAKGIWEITYGRPVSEMPPHGCTENLGGVLAPSGIAAEDVPSPFNIFQNMIIHADTGVLEHSHIRPKPPGAQVTLRAEMNLLAALSTCPDIAAGGSTGATLALFAAE